MALWPALLLLLLGASSSRADELSSLRGDHPGSSSRGEVVLPGVRRSAPDVAPSGGIIFPDDPLLSHGPGEEPRILGPEQSKEEVLELPDDLDELPLTALEKMNSIQTIDEFLALFNLEAPVDAETESSTDNLNSGLSISSRFGATGTATAKMAICKPERRTVSLKLPEEPNTIYYPSCVRLPRCGGCCVGSQLECQPTAVKPIKLEVIKTVAKSGTSRRSSGRRRRRRTPPTKVVVEEEEHTECKCNCKVQESHCNLEVHSYSKNECSCVCKNKDEEKKCASKNTTHFWDPKKCQCLCRKTQGCSTGQDFSHVSCSCEWPLASRSGLRAPASRPEDGDIGFPDWRRGPERRRNNGRRERRRPQRVSVERDRGRDRRRGHRRPELVPIF